MSNLGYTARREYFSPPAPQPETIEAAKARVVAWLDQARPGWRRVARETECSVSRATRAEL